MSEQPDQININAASKEQLVTLPGIGDALADRILAARPYSSLDGLKEVLERARETVISDQ